MMKHLIFLAITVALSACASQQGVTPAGGAYQGKDPSQRTTSRSEVAKVRTELAAQYIRERKLDAAQRQLEDAFKADSRYAPAYDMMGNLLRSEGSPHNLKRADEYFKKAISIDPNFTQARNNYGVYLSEQGRHKEAIEQFSIAGATLGYEGRVASLENLGLTYLKIRDEKSAEAAFMRALDADPSTVQARIEMTDIMINQRRTLQAKEYFDGVRALYQMHGEPMPPRLLLQGIRLAIAQNNPQERQRLSTELLSQHPLSDEAKRLKAWLSNPKGAPLK